MWRCSWRGHIRPDVEYWTALFKYYHGNNPSCGALFCSHKLFKYRHSDTPLISARVMSWQHFLPLLCFSGLFSSLEYDSSIVWPKTHWELDIVFGHSSFLQRPWEWMPQKTMWRQEAEELVWVGQLILFISVFISVVLFPTTLMLTSLWVMR